ncbi:hypothetical protein [Saccharopolyspora shandongensis]|uniref:hypothetical protein n=1 Tax=Saccharopolyspora shandongensis TaxID=418495 RepID=UPI00340A8703
MTRNDHEPGMTGITANVDVAKARELQAPGLRACRVPVECGGEEVRVLRRSVDDRGVVIGFAVQRR